MKSFVNEGASDRWIRIVLGIILLAAGIMTSHALSILLYVVGAVALLTGVFGFCIIYRLFGVNTCRVKQRSLQRSCE